MTGLYCYEIIVIYSIDCFAMTFYYIFEWQGTKAEINRSLAHTLQKVPEKLFKI